MGFLKRIFGGRAASFEDRIWLRSDLKLKDAIGRISADARADDRVSIAAYHFAATGDALRKQLQAAGMVCEDLRAPDTAQLESLPARLGPRDVGLVHSAGLPDRVKLGEAKRSRAAGDATACHVHLVEHYPMLYRDTHVLHLGGLLGEGSRFYGYAALDEPWLDRVVGRSVQPLLERLGLDESEPLEHAVVSAALRRAQAQLGQRLRRSERHADSIEDWVRQNLGG